MLNWLPRRYQSERWHLVRGPRALRFTGFGGCSCCGGSCSTTICVVACGIGIPGSTVSVLSGGSTVATGTTGSTGCVSLTIPAAGAQSVTVTIPGFPANTSSQTLTCGGTTTINLGSPPTGGVCCGATTSSPCNCAPYPETIFITDDCGTTALTSTGGAEWVGCTSCGASGGATNTTTEGGGQLCAEAGGQVSIRYTVGCSPSSSSGDCESGTSATTWSVVRTWFVCIPSDTNCPPLYCQNPFSTDGNCTPIVSGDQEPCGESFEDTGSFTATSCTPLAVSGNLASQFNTCFPQAGGPEVTVPSPLGPSFSLSS
jgi:hypothetical protein